MIMTENQRRWWFATHPECSRQSAGSMHPPEDGERRGERRVSPREVDEYVDQALKHETGPVADLLRSVKRHFGSEGDSAGRDLRLAYADDRSGTQPSEREEDENQREAGLWDAVLQGIDNTLTDWEDWFGVAIGPTTPSRKLGRAMTKDGRPRPSPDHDAHHIVPAEDSRFDAAGEAREIPARFKIDLYDSANGVGLPRKRGVARGAYHPALHNKEYYAEVLRLLREVGTREKMIVTLKKIGRELEKGPFLKIGGAR